MCFSSSASFTAAAALVVTGVYTTRKFHTVNVRPLALVPMVFAVQQAAEGVLWISAEKGDYRNEGMAAYIFLFVAQVIWPVLIPFAIWKIEKNIRRARMLLGLSAAGTLCSGLLLYRLVVYPIHTDTSHYHILYTIASTQWLDFVTNLLYALVILLPPFLSSYSRMRWIGAALVLAFTLSVYFYRDAVISIWCYFAALISLAIVYALQTVNSSVRQTAI